MLEWLNILNLAKFEDLLTTFELNLNKIIYSHVIEYPDCNKLFKPFNLCVYKDLKVVLIGYEPKSINSYSTGILFGNNRAVKETNLSPCLKILKEAMIDFEIPHNGITFDPSLESICKQGVLMLNLELPYFYHNRVTILHLWRDLILNMIKNLNRFNPGLIYVLLGNQAINLKYAIGKNNYVLEEKSPIDYVVEGRKMPSTVFKEVNNILKLNNNFKINWYE